MSDVQVGSRRWFVISTKVRREHYAQEQLQRRGVETFLPRIVEHGRLRLTPNIAPLFPGYLFVHVDLEQQYFDVAWAPGVRKFIGFGALPSALDDALIDFLQARVGSEGVIRIVPAFKQGDLVRITHGPFEGLIGIIERPVSRQGRVRVLMELLRRQTRVDVPQRIVERISA